MKYWYLIALLALCGCGKELLEPDLIDRGALPLSPYVAIGGSETAGFADGALHLEAQAHSYPALIAGQLALVGGGSFLQPLTIDSGGFAFTGGTLYARLQLGTKADCNGDISTVPVRTEVTSGTLASYGQSSQQGPYGNWGLPFLRAEYIDKNNLSAFSPYYYRMGADSITLLQAITNRNPKLFTIWVGMEDLLGYAINQTLPAAPIQYYNYLLPLVDSLVQDTTAAGFIATLPDITTLPFFNTIPYNALELEQPLADALNQLYAGTGMVFQAGANAFVIEDAAAPGGKRQIKAGEKLLLTLPLDSVKCLFLGSLTPISARYVLDEAEIDFIRYHQQGYNNFLYQLADEKGLIVVDMEALYSTLGQGILINGVTFNDKLVSGGFFSLDGMNPSARGAAIIANEFIKTMNQEYKAAIPLVSVLEQPGIRFP